MAYWHLTLKHILAAQLDLLDSYKMSLLTRQTLLVFLQLSRQETNSFWHARGKRTAKNNGVNKREKT